MNVLGRGEVGVEAEPGRGGGRMNERSNEFEEMNESVTIPFRDSFIRSDSFTNVTTLVWASCSSSTITVTTVSHISHNCVVSTMPFQ